MKQLSASQIFKLGKKYDFAFIADATNFLYFFTYSKNSSNLHLISELFDFEPEI